MQTSRRSLLGLFAGAIAAAKLPAAPAVAQVAKVDFSIVPPMMPLVGEMRPAFNGMLITNPSHSHSFVKFGYRIWNGEAWLDDQSVEGRAFVDRLMKFGTLSDEEIGERIGNLPPV